MKLINIKLKTLLPLAFAGIILLAGCKKTWLDINTNPNTLPPPRPDYVLTSAINRNAAVVTANETGEYWSAQWTQSSTYVLSPTLFTYNFNNTNFNYWDGWYDILQDFQFAINNADKNNLPALKGLAKVMQAYIFQELVDCYGNIPYTDALKGAGGLAPKFDNQKVVYESLVKLLDDAIADLKANTFDAISSAADIVYKGSAVNWTRFANSLKLRILIRQSRIAGRDAYIITEINKAAAVTEGFLATGQDVGSTPGYLAATSQTNPLYDYIGYDPNGATRAYGRFPRPTTFILNSLIATNDTFRLKRLFYAFGGESATAPGVSAQPEVLSNYIGVPYGISSGYLAQNTSFVGPSQIIKGVVNNPMYLMTCAESFFLLAEAKQLYGTAITLPANGTDGTAKGYYEQGVKESFRLTGTTAKYGADKVTTLLTSGKDLADWTASPDKLKAIWQQKWLALTNFNGLEAWAEYRRTGFPVIPLSASAPVGAKPPVRLFYPTTELSSNGDNVKAQGTIDVFSGKIFWDVD
ncbi:MAG TPA: SusD/RagB family nutrient-binding outer membrane lipoprotein [Chitinophagaceae bacterium]|nr:SusD/RagB family nutrient-binding outer membrane lipoprotein [Chitinophagaceae bacterium]